MAYSYTRQSTISDGDTITAALFNNEYNQLLNSFAYSSSDAAATGHRHDGSAAQGGSIYKIGDLDFLNKIEADSTNNRWGIYVQVSSSAVEQIRVQDGAIVPVTDNDIDLGTSSLEFKDAYFDGTVTTDALVADTADINGGTVDGATIGASSATTIVGTTITANTAFVPDASDGASLGTTSLEFSDLYLADGAVINLGDDQDTTLTHVADTGILLNSTRQFQFGDSGTYIHQSADGVLDLVSDTEIELTATTIDINGAVDVSGEIAAASLDISGNVDIDGTTNLDAVDIDGAVQIDGATTFGVDDTGVDVKFFGATASAYLLWDESADKLLTAGGAVVDIVKDKLLIGGTAVTTTAAELNVLDAVTAGTVTASLGVVVDSNKDIGTFRNITLSGELDAGSLDISGNADIDGTTNLDAVDIDGAVQIDATVTVGVDDTGYDVKFFGDAASAYMLWDASADDLILGGAARVVVPDGQLVLGSTAVSSTAAELNILDGKSFVDEDDMSSDSATAIASQQSIKAYVDNNAGMSNWILEDGDGTEVTISNAKEVKFVEGGGIDINWTDTDNGTDGDPYDLTFTINAAQTDITSLLATDIKIGEDDQTKIDFEDADKINFYAGNEKQLILEDGALYPGADNIIDLGKSDNEFKDAFFDGTVTADAFAGPLTGNVTGNVSGTAATVTGAAQSNITSLGTLTTLTVDSVIVNGTTIGHTDDTDLMTVADGVLTVAGEVSMTTLDIGGTNVTSTAAELNKLDGVGTLKQAGLETIYVPAAAMYPNSTNGCADLTQVELANGPELKCLDFDPSSDENAQFTVCFPKSWNEGTVTFQAFFTVTGTNTGTVAWGLSGGSTVDDGSINTAFGTNVVATAKAHSGTSNDMDVSAVSGAVTIANAAADSMTFFQIMRDVSADNQSGDARLLGIKLFFTTDAANDS